MTPTTSESLRWCPSTVTYRRRETVEVTIGDLRLGSAHPIRLQSMTTTNTMDTEATIAQSIRMIEAGCELVRITAPSMREAKNLEAIRAGLRQRGYSTPLVADIHYTPNAAEIAARVVEKVRINPGNYVDKKQFAVKEYDDVSYAAELDRVRDKFVPLLRICKEYGTALRIGTNHGSLSDRIVNRFGDNPVGMVESALEFLRIADDEGFHNIVLSMKSSNPLIMIAAYRLLVARLDAEGLSPYPLHLGVTEAGDGEDGRIKSAVGIGTLLEDGLGDTIRVSLTEEPEAEIPVARDLASRYPRSASPVGPERELPWDVFTYRRRATTQVANIGHDTVPRVVADISNVTITSMTDLAPYGHHYDAVTDKWSMTEMGADYLYVGQRLLPFMPPNGTRLLVDYTVWLTLEDRFYNVPVLTLEEWGKGATRHSVVNVLRIDVSEIPQLLDTLTSDASTTTTVVVLLSSSHVHWMPSIRYAMAQLIDANVRVPVLFHYVSQNPQASPILAASTDLGGLFADGLGDGLMMANPSDPAQANTLTFGILQATRTRMTKAEYISCPSCGRTLFDLQETTAAIRAATDHLIGVKIGIMGCIVNGPGEMADADYGYVGSGPDRITLYKGQEIVKRNIPTTEAISELLSLINADRNSENS